MARENASNLLIVWAFRDHVATQHKLGTLYGAAARPCLKALECDLLLESLSAAGGEWPGTGAAKSGQR